MKVTVHSDLCRVVASRVNRRPVAVAKPSTQEVNQPNDLVIDGSGMLTTN